jgi:hypothetical protein
MDALLSPPPPSSSFSFSSSSYFSFYILLPLACHNPELTSEATILF